jgi:hypothetical protein
MSKIKALQKSLAHVLNGAIQTQENLQSANHEYAGQKHLLGLGDWERPNNSLWHKQENYVRDDVRNLRGIIKRVGINAGAFN